MDSGHDMAFVIITGAWSSCLISECPALWQLGIISEVSGKKSVLSRASEINGIHGLDVVWTKHDGNHSQPPQTRQTFSSE